MNNECLTTIEEVGRYWDTYINDIEICQSSVGTLEFFNELRAYRYEKYSYLPDLVGFEQYRNAKVLEIGCGPGIDLVEFARAGADVWAIDLSTCAVDLVRKNLMLNGFGQKTQQIALGNAEELDFPSDTFDVVYSIGVLHHTVNTEDAIREVHRVLKPNGEAIIMLYNRWSWFNALAVLTGINIEHKDEDAPIIRRYSIRQCRQIFRQFGGSVEIHVNQFPTRTLKHANSLGKLYNTLFVPLFEAIPKGFIRQFGWHIVIRARKENS